jgi:hypothetical protein
MFISEKEIEFYAGGKAHKYNILDFSSYEVVKARRRYTDYRLHFADTNSYIVSSFKAGEFGNMLDKIIANTSTNSANSD